MKRENDLFHQKHYCIVNQHEKLYFERDKLTFQSVPFCKNPENYAIKSLSADSYRMERLSCLNDKPHNG